MTFIKSFSINANRKTVFPYSVLAIKFAKQVELGERITIFVGDNGCGKSTLLETIGLHLNIPLIGGYISSHAGFEAAKKLQPFLEIEWKREVRKGFFFRAEDFSDFVNSVERHRNKLFESYRDLKGEVDDAIIEKMMESENYVLREMRRTYGEDMQAFSHGEAYLKIIQTRIDGKGIYILDEPEAALSPLKQLSLIAFILEVLKDNNTQFIISTHSPILMGIPGALIYEIRDEGMSTVSYDETDHYRITKTFLNNPQHYLRHF
jgi:predicted ATPase